MNKEAVLNQLNEIGAIKFGTFTLKSGIESPIYIDLRLIISYPKLMQAIADLMWKTVSNHSFDCLCGVPYTALPIATAISLSQDLPMVMKRKEPKKHGLGKMIEGSFEPGQNCLIVEDLITSGMSIFETIEPLENEGLKISDIIILIDRQQGGRERVEAKGYRLHSIFTLEEVMAICPC